MCTCVPCTYVRISLNLPRWGIARLHAHVQFYQKLPNSSSIYMPTSGGWEFLVPHVTFSSFRIFSFLTIWLFQNPVSCYFICISLTTMEIEHFFIYWLAIKIESVIWFFTDLLHFSNGLYMFSFFSLLFYRSSYI